MPKLQHNSQKILRIIVQKNPITKEILKPFLCQRIGNTHVS